MLIDEVGLTVIKYINPCVHEMHHLTVHNVPQDKSMTVSSLKTPLESVVSVYALPVLLGLLLS